MSPVTTSPQRRPRRRQRARTFDQFCAQVRRLLDQDATNKGYHAAGPDSENPLYTFIDETVGGPHHAVGEVIYKMRRYSARRQPEDLAKAAAWCFLIWRHDRAHRRPTVLEGR